LTAFENTADWWRPAAPAAVPTTVVTVQQQGSRIAFGALVAFTGILILSPQVWFPVLKSLRIALVAAGLAIVAQLLDRAVRSHSSDRLHKEIVIGFCLVGWAALTIPLSYWPGGSVEVLTDHFIKAIAFFWLIGTVITNDDRLKLFLWLLVVSSIPLAFTAAQNYQAGEFLQVPNGAAQRIAGYNVGGSGLTANPNDLALMLNLLIPFAAALIMTSRSVLARAVAAGALALSIVAVILTFSRAGFLTLVAMGIVGLASMVRRRPLIAIVTVLVLAVSSALMPKGYSERLATITNISADTTGSAQGRWNDLTVAVGIVAQNPLVGVGLGQNVLALNEHRGETWREIHNVYLQYAVDLGLPGLGLFLWLFVALFRTAGRVRRRAAREPVIRNVGIVAGSVQAALVGFAVAAFFHPVAYQFYFFCIAGLALAVRNVSLNTRASLRPVEQAA
jgi:probable O-glycosylation ligase (exosortase A-associated)